MAWNNGSIESSYVYDINRLFDTRMDELRQERSKAAESIDAWARALYFQINEHAREQKNLLQCYYNDREQILLGKRKETIDEMYKFSRQYDYNRISNLLEQCKTLKFELLVAFAYEDQPLSFIQCMTKEHLAQKQKNESSAAKTGNFRSEAQLQLKDGKDPGKNVDQYTGLSGDPASTFGQQTT